jgi:phosphatidylserine synthase
LSDPTGKRQGNFLYRNLANATSILGVLPMVLLFLDDGYRYLLPLIIFNNVMDDLDGVLAAKLNIRSQFGADLDNVCDAVAHVALALAVGAHFGGVVLILSTVAAGSIILRVASRLEPERATGGGSPTNELMRHLLFTVLVAQTLSLDPELVLILVFLLHSVSMLVPYKMSALIRAQAKSATSVGLVNAALVAAWLTPVVALPVAAVFLATYLYSFVAGGSQWLKARGNETSSRE